MKYLGEKSMSSFLSGLLKVGWYAVLAMAIIAGLVGAYLLFAPPNDLLIIKAAKSMELNLQDKDWIDFKKMPLIIRMFFMPYFITVVILILKLIKKARGLFENFKKDIVFDKSNVQIILSFSKLLIPFSVLTLDISSLMLSLFMFLLCEIFKNGTMLQEEHDLTI
jgi:hypothetical protein